VLVLGRVEGGGELVAAARSLPDGVTAAAVAFAAEPTLEARLMLALRESFAEAGAALEVLRVALGAGLVRGLGMEGV